ncbi:MAG: TM1812 family CRISPR-associated protein [Acidobacteriota bacterium]|nr:TM1812 family CRISPR-associated protein [Acidobacteriota bacterium]
MGMYYARFADGDDRAVPIIDLSPFLISVAWQEATGFFQRYGSLDPLVKVLDLKVRNAFEQSSVDRKVREALSRLKGRLSDLQSCLSLGLVVPVGETAAEVRDKMNELRDHGLVDLLPLGASAVDGTARAVSALAADADKHCLCSEELERQLRLARWYVEHNRPGLALLAIREWIINRTIFAGDEADRTGWLDYPGTRRRIERQLNARADWLRDSGNADGCEGDRVAAVWSSVAKYRNQIAHAGNSADARALGDRVAPKITAWIEDLEALHRDEGVWGSGHTGTSGTVILQPLGTSPGVLYTVLKKVPHDSLIVLGSEQSLPLVDSALAAAGVDVPSTRVQLESPWQAHKEFRRVRQEIEAELRSASDLVAVLTGGTAAMTVLVNSLARFSETLGTRVRRLLLLDSRNPEVQRTDPWHPGELEWIDAEDSTVTG